MNLRICLSQDKINKCTRTSDEEINLVLSYIRQIDPSIYVREHIQNRTIPYNGIWNYVFKPQTITKKYYEVLIHKQNNEYEIICLYMYGGNELIRHNTLVFLEGFLQGLKHRRLTESN